MESDNAYHAKCIPVALTLLQASGGDPSTIPQHYLDNFEHNFVDGDISLVTEISKLNDIRDLEEEEIHEILEFLEKVNPDSVPDPESIEEIQCEDFFSRFEKDSVDFAEDNLGLAEKVERCLAACIEGTFGDKVREIRDIKGKFPGKGNDFLRKEDGTFSGTFSHQDYKFIFEIAPTPKGWICTYRLSEKTLAKVPKRVDKTPRKGADFSRRRIRTQGWLS
jgi:hypothetical protein